MISKSVIMSMFKCFIFDEGAGSLFIIGISSLFVSPNWHLHINKVLLIEVDSSWHLSGNLIWESLNDSVWFVNKSGSCFLFIILVAVVVEIVGFIVWVAGVAITIDFIVVLFVWDDSAGTSITMSTVTIAALFTGLSISVFLGITACANSEAIVWVGGLRREEFT